MPSEYVGVSRVRIENGTIHIREDVLIDAAQATMDQWHEPPHRRVERVLQSIFGKVEVVQPKPVEE